MDVKVENKTCATALRTRCAEHTRAMQPAVYVHPVLYPSFIERLCSGQHGHKFDNHDERIKYYELVLERDLDEIPQFSLPEGYRFVFTYRVTVITDSSMGYLNCCHLFENNFK